MIPCDLVVSAVGLRPRTELAFAAGLAVNRGIVVDRSLRTSHANIYALGDCAEVDGLNLLYVMPLMACARALAQTLSPATPARWPTVPCR
ncbi:FAD-dependent oxidoreductase [Pseudomonas aeruginosa]|uniref:FAD-dependent oxidoreductase n=1 Tax=Pseudomonas aeruginosa TaxID=287 RepID=UPI004053FB15